MNSPDEARNALVRWLDGLTSSPPPPEPDTEVDRREMRMIFLGSKIAALLHGLAVQEITSCLVEDRLDGALGFDDAHHTYRVSQAVDHNVERDRRDLLAAVDRLDYQPRRIVWNMVEHTAPLAMYRANVRHRDDEPEPDEWVTAMNAYIDGDPTRLDDQTAWHTNALTWPRTLHPEAAWTFEGWPQPDETDPEHA